MLDEIRHKYRIGNIIIKLLIINIGIFVMQSILLLIFTISGAQNTFLSFVECLYFPKSLNAF
ncbi:MAG: hypothetical protein ACK4IY_10050, partial [Chitinophagales bacterium]